MKTLEELSELIKIQDSMIDVMKETVFHWQAYSVLCSIKQLLENDKHQLKYEDRIKLLEGWKWALDWFLGEEE